MLMRPSRVEELLAEMPEDLQKAGLQAIAEERARFARGDFTEKEKADIAFARKCGAAAGAHSVALALEVITNEKEKGQ